MNRKIIYIISAFFCFGGPIFGNEEDKLFQAVNSGDVDSVIELIVKEDLSLNEYYTENGVHLLAVALRNNDIDMFRRLLMGGADPNRESSKQSQLSVGARILDAPMREDFLVEALRFGLNPNLATMPHIGSTEKLPLLFRTTGHSYQLSYFVILINYGARLDSDSDWLNLFKRALISDNFRLAWYLLASEKFDAKNLGEKSWWAEFIVESSDLFTENVAYWRDAVINEVNALKSPE